MKKLGENVLVGWIDNIFKEECVEGERTAEFRAACNELSTKDSSITKLAATSIARQLELWRYRQWVVEGEMAQIHRPLRYEQDQLDSGCDGRAINVG